MRKKYLLLAMYFLLSGSLWAAASAATELPAPTSSVDAASAEEVRQMQLKQTHFTLLDARNLNSYQIEHIEGAVLPMSSEYYAQQALFQSHVISSPPDTDEFLKRSMEKYPKGTKLITYCHKGCQVSEVLMLKLRALGFTDVKFMRDGIDAWKEKGYPVVSTVQNTKIQ